MSGVIERPWDAERAIRVVLYEFYSDAHESWANRDAQDAIEGRTRFIRPSVKRSKGE